MARIPTTENCAVCANETPEKELVRSGRRQIRVFQNLDDNSYECERGHKVTFESSEPPQPTVAVSQTPERKPAETADRGPFANTTPPPKERETTAFPSQEGSVAVAEEPQSVLVVPGSAKIRPDHRLSVELLVPEQFASPLQEFCNGLGKTTEEYLSEFMSQAFENGWIL